MPDIVRRQARPIRTRATLAFTGAANLGAINTSATVFTITGRVWVHALTAFCTETLVGNTATVSLGTASGVANIIGTTTSTDLVLNDWWIDITPAEIGYANLVQTLASGPSLKDFVLSEDLIVRSLTAGTTDGTLVFDIWYTPLTDNGALT